MLDDLRHTLHALLRQPGHALLSLLTLSCGLGFAIYAAGVYFSFSAGDIPFPEAERLLAIEASRDGERTQANSVHYLDYLELKQNAQRSGQSFEDVQALQTATVTLGGGQRYPANFKAAYLPATLWPWLGRAAQPQLGRQLQASDERPGAPPVAVLGARVWREFLGADPRVVGSRLKVNGVETEIVGIMPAGFRMPMTQQLWLPFQAPAGPLTRGPGLSMGTPQHTLVLAKLKPGAAAAQAQAELDLSARQLATAFPANNARVGFIALPYAAWGLPDLDEIYLGLAGAAMLLLALVCINTGNLLLARANERRQELAVRAALGAPRGRLMAQMLGETLLLCLLASAIGLFFSAWALEATHQAVQATADDRLPFWVRFELRPQAALFGLGLSLLTALATGLLPAWRASAVDLNAVLRDGRGSQGRASGRFARALVFVQVALSSLLLLASGVQTYTVHQRLNAGTGARMEGLLTAQLTPRLAQYQAGGANAETAQAAREALWSRLETRLQEAASSVGAAVAMSTSLPGGGMTSTDEILPDGMTVRDELYPLAGNYSINNGYFQTLEVKLLAGREFGPQDRKGSLAVAVINRNFAEQHWPGQNPLGKRFAIVGSDAKKTAGEWITVVGLVPHVLQGPGREQNQRAANFYLPISQSAPTDLGIALVGVPDQANSRELLARAVALSDPALALERVFSGEERQRIAHGGEDVMAVMSLILGLLTLLLAASGIYGVSSRAVQMRRQEIGVRRAVGASDGQMMRLLLGQALRQLALALPLGLVGGALAVGQEVDSQLLLSLGASVTGLLIAAVLLLSTWLPARRALRQLPSQALNSA